MTRELSWARCVNVRDLGGVPIAGGGKTKPGAFVRADNVAMLSREGWQSLVDHGVTRIVDLRWAEETERDPPRDVDVEVVHVSLLGAYDPELRDEIDDFLPDDVAGYRAAQYLAFLEHHRAEFARVFAALADTDGVVLFHCLAGKDRTGLIAALLLRLAGASIDDAAADYELSDGNATAMFESWINDADTEQERHRRLFLARTPAEAMARTLRELGDVADYLRDAGLTDDEIDRLRRRLAAA